MIIKTNRKLCRKTFLKYKALSPRVCPHITSSNEILDFSFTFCQFVTWLPLHFTKGIFKNSTGNRLKTNQDLNCAPPNERYRLSVIVLLPFQQEEYAHPTRNKNFLAQLWIWRSHTMLTMSCTHFPLHILMYLCLKAKGNCFSTGCLITHTHKKSPLMVKNHLNSTYPCQTHCTHSKRKLKRKR